ncbi:hypothetical protein VQH23_07350 [Pararoseomonas sp. SCSIO 73927]|uniref:hypothetical protein n=1 Tax=Pararoseomonas sp. SCSIO 73927 TaxID=3114537 RepID=UPI0030CEA6F6
MAVPAPVRLRIRQDPLGVTSGTPVAGQAVRIRIDASDEAGKPLDVDGLVLVVLRPGAKRAVRYQAVRLALGAYYVDLPLDAGGNWRFLARCRTPRDARAELTLKVAGSTVLPTSPPPDVLLTEDDEILTFEDGAPWDARRVKGLPPATGIAGRVMHVVGPGGDEHLPLEDLVGAAGESVYYPEAQPDLKTPMIEKLRQFPDMERDFKARMDGASDDTAPLVDAVRSGKRVLFPPEYRPLVTYDEAKTNGPCRLEGNGRLSPIIQRTYCMRVVRVMDDDCYLSGLRFIQPHPMVKPTSAAKPNGYWPYGGSAAEGLNDSMGQIAALHITGNRFTGRDLGFTNFPVSIRLRPVDTANHQNVGADMRGIFTRNTDFGILFTSIADFHLELKYENITGTDIIPGTGLSFRPPHPVYGTNPGSLAESPEDDLEDTPTQRLNEGGYLFVEGNGSRFSDVVKIRGARGIEIHILTRSQETAAHISYSQGVNIASLTADDMAPAPIWDIANRRWVEDPNPVTGAGYGVSFAYATDCIVNNPLIIGRSGFDAWGGMRAYYNSERCVMIGGRIVRNSTADLKSPFARFERGSRSCGMRGTHLVDRGAGDYYAIMDTGGDGTVIDRVTIDRENKAATRGIYIGSLTKNFSMIAPDGLFPGEGVAAVEDYGTATAIKKPIYLTHLQLPAPARVPGHSAVLKAGTDGRTDEQIYSTGTAWLYRDKAPVQVLSIAAQPASTVAGAELTMRVQAQNLAAVRFTVLDSSGATVGSPVVVKPMAGAALFSGVAPGVGTGYAIRAEDPAGGVAAVTSGAFSVTAPAAWSFAPLDLGAQYVAAATLNNPACFLPDGAGGALEVRDLYDPTKRLVAANVAIPPAPASPQLITTAGITGDKRALVFSGSQYMRTEGNWPALAQAFNGDLSASSWVVWVAGRFASLSGRSMLGAWVLAAVSTPTRTELRSQGTAGLGKQLLVRSPNGNTQSDIAAGNPDTAPFVACFAKQGGTIHGWINGFDPVPHVTRAVTGGGVLTATDFLLGATVSGGAYTPSAFGEFTAFMVANGTFPLVLDGRLHNGMRWAGDEIGRVVP